MGSLSNSQSHIRIAIGHGTWPLHEKLGNTKQNGTALEGFNALNVQKSANMEEYVQCKSNWPESTAQNNVIQLRCGSTTTCTMTLQEEQLQSSLTGRAKLQGGCIRLWPQKQWGLFWKKWSNSVAIRHAARSGPDLPLHLSLGRPS